MEKDFSKESIRISKQEPFYKIIAVIITLLQKGFYVTDFLSTSNLNNDYFIFKVCKTNNSFGKTFYKNEKLGKMHFTYSSTKNIIIKFTCNNEINYTANMKIQYKKSLETGLIEVSNINQIINKLIFYEENINDLIIKLNKIKNNRYIELQINEFYKLKKYIHFINLNENINTVYIDKFIKSCNRLKRGDKKVFIGPFKLLFNDHYNISIGGIKFIEEYNLRKYKYLNLPQLNIFLKMIFETDLFNKFNSTINKQILQKV